MDNVKRYKDVEYYMKLPYTIHLTPDPDGGYAIAIPLLPGCISQGENAQDAMNMIKDAQRQWIITALEDGIEIPEP